MLHRRLHSGQELADHRVPVGRVHRVHAAEHHDQIDHDQIDVESERTELGNHLIEVAVVATGKYRDLHALERDAGGGAKLAHAGDDADFSGFVARVAAGVVRHEATCETQVGGDDAEMDGGFEMDFLAHE